MLKPLSTCPKDGRSPSLGQVNTDASVFFSSGAIRALTFLAFLTGSAGCSLMVTRPVQDMSQTGAALRAAKEVQADTVAPELYRQASEYFLKAKREYKLKNFDFAKTYAERARRLAEQAEFEAIKAGINRSDDPVLNPLASGTSGMSVPLAPPPPPGAAKANPEGAAPPPDQDPNAPTPAPEGTPIEIYEAKRQAELQKLKEELPSTSLEGPENNPPPAFVNPGGMPNPQPNSPGPKNLGTLPPPPAPSAPAEAAVVPPAN
jgi:hypothetical protein